MYPSIISDLRKCFESDYNFERVVPTIEKFLKKRHVEKWISHRLCHVKSMTMVITLTGFGDTTQDSGETIKSVLNNIVLSNTSTDIIQMKKTVQCSYLFLISKQLNKFGHDNNDVIGYFVGLEKSCSRSIQSTLKRGENINTVFTKFGCVAFLLHDLFNTFNLVNVSIMNVFINCFSRNNHNLLDSSC